MLPSELVLLEPPCRFCTAVVANELRAAEAELCVAAAALADVAAVFAAAALLTAAEPAAFAGLLAKLASNREYWARTLDTTPAGELVAPEMLFNTWLFADCCATSVKAAMVAATLLAVVWVGALVLALLATVWLVALDGEFVEAAYRLAKEPACDDAESEFIDITFSAVGSVPF